jgi:hypothetical protein
MPAELQAKTPDQLRTAALDACRQAAAIVEKKGEPDEAQAFKGWLVSVGDLTPDLIQKASGYVGESSGATQKALGGIVPTLVSALMNTASTDEGARQLARTLDTGKYDGSALNSVTSLFAGGMTTQSASTR